MKRRQFVAGGLVSVAAAKVATAQEAAKAAKEAVVHAKEVANSTINVHDFANVISKARRLAKEKYSDDRLQLSGPFDNLNYDQYRGIRFRREADPLQEDTHNFGMDLLPPGNFYQDRVRISLVSIDGTVEDIPFSTDVFDFDPQLFASDNLALDAEQMKGLSWSGFRLRFPINVDEINDEFIVFQGASYFRAVARDTLYGLSARGLALKTGEPDGEEFPRFSHFWIYRPQAGEQFIRLEALLESPSITGAYTFEIFPGAETICNVQCHLFPRVNVSKYGIAPLTSMYYFSPTRRNRIDDYREAVHDSNGLAIYTGAGARLWRSLANPSTLQYSVFMDNNPKGFGFVQRARHFNDYQDAEARYEKRPSTWVEPLDKWGKGGVSLIEIPTDTEFNDNVIAFWAGENVLEAGKSYAFSYRLAWSQQGPRFASRAKIIATRIGKSVNDSASYTIIIDYRFPMPVDTQKLQLTINATRGKILASHVFQLPHENITRASFEYQAEKNTFAELQAAISMDGNVMTETWMYRWHPG